MGQSYPDRDNLELMFDPVRSLLVLRHRISMDGQRIFPRYLLTLFGMHVEAEQPSYGFLSLQTVDTATTNTAHVEKVSGENPTSIIR